MDTTRQEQLEPAIETTQEFAHLLDWKSQRGKCTPAIHPSFGESLGAVEAVESNKGLLDLAMLAFSAVEAVESNKGLLDLAMLAFSAFSFEGFSVRCITSSAAQGKTTKSNILFGLLEPPGGSSI